MKNKYSQSLLLISRCLDDDSNELIDPPAKYAPATYARLQHSSLHTASLAFSSVNPKSLSICSKLPTTSR
ncbi:MAG: hypothetical protein MJ223_00600 [Mycoplasmoidaceae bacterium]|nr:hypothetical protein [Mycoplasmoidaceae bacterium]